MDTISYAYADEAHSRIDTLENIVTRYGDEVTLIGDVMGSTFVSSTGEIMINTVIADNSHNHTIDNIDGIENLVIDGGTF